MHARLAYTLALSVSLHAAILLAGSTVEREAPPAPAPLEIRLRLPPAPAEALLKDTLAADERRARDRPTPVERSKPLPKTQSALQQPAPASPARELRAAQKKLAQHQYYPPEAIAAGIEGEVHLLISLDADGSVDNVEIAAGSGHPVLDKAAVRAAWAMGSLPGASRRELILPVVFSLR